MWLFEEVLLLHCFPEYTLFQAGRPGKKPPPSRPCDCEMGGHERRGLTTCREDRLMVTRDVRALSASGEALNPNQNRTEPLGRADILVLPHVNPRRNRSSPDSAASASSSGDRKSGGGVGVALPPSSGSSVLESRFSSCGAQGRGNFFLLSCWPATGPN